MTQSPELCELGPVPFGFGLIYQKTQSGLSFFLCLGCNLTILKSFSQKQRIFNNKARQRYALYFGDTLRLCNESRSCKITPKEYPCCNRRSARHFCEKVSIIPYQAIQQFTKGPEKNSSRFANCADFLVELECPPLLFKLRYILLLVDKL